MQDEQLRNAEDELEDLARRLMDGAVPADGKLEALAEGFHALSRRLYAGLTPLFGSMGTRMVMSRAVLRASTIYPVLKGAMVFENGLEVWEVIAGKPEEDYDELRAALEALLLAFLETLASLLGKPLAGKVVHGHMASAEWGWAPGSGDEEET